MRIDLARPERAALDVVLDARRAEARHQARHQHDGRAHLLGQAVHRRVEVGVLVVDVEDAGLEVDADPEPSFLKTPTIFFTSVIRARRAAALAHASAAWRRGMGRTAFLLAEGMTRPERGVPP